MTSNQPFQFSLRAMLIGTAGIAVVLALWFVVPSWVAMPVWIFVLVALPAVLTIGVLHGKGSRRTFCIGALFPAGAGLLRTKTLWSESRNFFEAETFVFGFRLFDSENAQLAFGIATICVIAFSVVVGFICVGFRRWLERDPHDGQVERGDHPRSL